MSEAALELERPEELPVVHYSVMQSEVIEALSPRRGQVFVDATAGAGGHAEALLDAAPEVSVIAFDRDPQAISRCRERLVRFGRRARVVHLEFAAIEDWLAANRVDSVDGLIADLGVSSPQLDEASRGMSFRLEGPIDMRMDTTRGETALELIDRVSQDELADIIYLYGGERRSRRVARCVKAALDSDGLETTLDLRKAIVRAVGPRRIGGIDPATKTFQALRIAVNRELEQLDQLLDSLPRIVRNGGVAAVLSFHSLEDRKVKQAFLRGECFERLTKKPVVAGEEELENNPRSRSAKLRAARIIRLQGRAKILPMERPPA